MKVYRHYPIADYPSNIGLIVSDDGYGKNEYIETSRPIVIVTAPGPGSRQDGHLPQPAVSGAQARRERGLRQV